MSSGAFECKMSSCCLTMSVKVQVVQRVGPQQNVCLPLQGLAKGVVAFRYHIVKHTACREDVYHAGLKHQR